MSRPAPAEAGRSETLRGRVERVVFHTEDSGACILKLRVAGRAEPVTLIGKAPRVVPGEEVEAQGRWQSSRDYGPQFKADCLSLRRPDSAEGLERYLGSGLIEGIGPAYAKRLLDKFGGRIFAIIENESARLEEVEGIGRKRRQEIRASWMKQKAVHGIMLFLHGHGISSARALRIYKTYGDEALQVLAEDPYRLAQDIPGVGFKTADAIACQMGLAADSPARQRAALLHALEAAADAGHTCLPEARAFEQAAALVGAPIEAMQAQLAALLAAGRLARVEAGDEARLCLPELRAAEQTIARRVIELVRQPPDYPELDLSAGLAAAAAQTGKALAPSQQQAVQEALRQRCLILTGGPGVGKTTILKTLLSLLDGRGLKIVLAAPTGRAAKRLEESTGREARTLHRLLEAQGGGIWGRHAGRPLSGDLFVCDEVSMIDTALMARFLAALPAEAHLLLVGDADQLPSVGPGRVLDDLIASGRVPCVRLTEIFRQAAESRIVTSAHAINQGRLPDLRPARDSDFFFLEAADPETQRATVVDLVQARLPGRYGFDPLRDIQVLTPMHRHLLGTRALNERLQAALNPPQELKPELERFGTTFRVGDKVIQTHNNYDKDVFNGDIGCIVAIDTEPLRLAVRFDGQRRVEYEPGELDELQLAYALSIHKSQGSEFPCVVIPVSAQHAVMFERSLLYTAVTRARRLVVLVGDPQVLAQAVRRQSSRRRWTGLRALLAAY